MLFCGFCCPLVGNFFKIIKNDFGGLSRGFKRLEIGMGQRGKGKSYGGDCWVVRESKKTLLGGWCYFHSLECHSLGSRGVKITWKGLGDVIFTPQGGEALEVKIMSPRPFHVIYTPQFF